MHVKSEYTSCEMNLHKAILFIRQFEYDMLNVLLFKLLSHSQHFKCIFARKLMNYYSFSIFFTLTKTKLVKDLKDVSSQKAGGWGHILGK